MKRNFLLGFAMMATALTMLAQRSYTAPNVSSPEIAKDGAVTFKVKAAGADTVRLIIDTTVLHPDPNRATTASCSLLS